MIRFKITYPEEIFEDVNGEWMRAIDVEPLIALLREAKREHRPDSYGQCPVENTWAPGPCDCGAAEWNARVDKVLNGVK